MIVNRCFGCMEETTSNPCPHCGYLHQEQNLQGYVLQPGTILHGKYLIGKVLGQGGFGITYIGWDLALSRKVAIKEYFPAACVSRDTNLTTNLQWYHTEQAQEAMNAGQEMFLKEARKMNTVASIPQVVHVQDIFQDNCTSYIVMNYIYGETLAKRISRTGPLPWQTAMALLLPIADAMQTVHDAGLIHRDLSPDNLMLKTDGSIIILDLGAAKDLNLSSGASSMQVAKGGFSPMEQYVMRGNSGPWTDVYSLAATMYFALTGVVPPSAVERMDQDNLRWNLPQLRDVPPHVIALLQQAMAVQIKDRIQSMRDFAEGLRKKNAKKNTKKKSRKNWKVFVGIGAAAAVITVAAIVGALIDTEETIPYTPSTQTTLPAPTATGATEAPVYTEDGTTWSNNVLMSAHIPTEYEYDQELAPVFNSRITRQQIVSVTFLDSLDNMGSNAWDVSQNRDKSVMAWTKANGTISYWADSKTQNMDGYDLFIAAEGGINGKYCAYLFSGYNNVVSIDFNGCFHTDYAESMEEMFSACYDLVSLDVRQLETGNVRNMSYMFTGTAIESLDLSNFDTSKVENMTSMFYNCNDLESLDLRNFNTSKVTNMSDMFCLTSSLTKLDISSFNTSKVKDMSFMFSLTALTDLDLSHFDTSNVESMSYMFSGCKSLVSVDASNFNTSKVTRMNGTFSDCIVLEYVYGLSDWDLSNVTSHDEFMDEDVTVGGEPWETLFD